MTASRNNRRGVAGFDQIKVSKHQKPYLNATLELDLAKARIHGVCKRAPVRPDNSQLTQIAMTIGLRIDSQNHIYGIIDGTPHSTTEDLVGRVMELLLDQGEARSAAS